MRAEHRRYVVPGWGVGDLWTSEGVVIAHELEFEADAGAGEVWSEPATALAESAPAEGESRAGAPDSRGGPPSSRAGPPEGAHGPPTSTVPVSSSRVVGASVPKAQHLARAPRVAARVHPDELVERLVAFFAGADPALDGVPVDLTWATPFQHSVAVTLRAVPRGEVVSYGELAALAGYPGAPRAVGTFCARNRLMLLVPCHRVVGADSIGGYGSAGVDVKRRLLALEGVVV